MKLHVTTRIHGRKHLYNTSVYGDIYRYICGGLGVVISQLVTALYSNTSPKAGNHMS